MTVGLFIKLWENAFPPREVRGESLGRVLSWDNDDSLVGSREAHTSLEYRLVRCIPWFLAAGTYSHCLQIEEIICVVGDES